jgi:dihydrofolate reductase
MTEPTPAVPALELVVAIADNGVIGRELGLPWRQRADLQHFKAVTLGHPILMGRRTWQSIGRPLPGRMNLVLSRDGGFVAPGARVVPSLAAALRSAGPVPALMIIGGATLYSQTLAQASTIHLTEVHGAPDGEVRFPDWDRAAWAETKREWHAASAENEYPYSFVTLRRG